MFSLYRWWKVDVINDIWYKISRGLMMWDEMFFFFNLPDFPTPPSPRITHLKTRGPIRLFWDLLVVREAEIISLLEEFPTLFACFLFFFLPFPIETSDDIFVFLLHVFETQRETLHLYLHTFLLLCALSTLEKRLEPLEKNGRKEKRGEFFRLVFKTWKDA